MKSNKIIPTFIFAMLILTALASAQMYEIDYSNSTSYPIAISNPYLVVQVLKYDPYPVNAGGWFDLWIKVQNIGQNNAPDARFELVPEYPFSSSDSLVRDYGIIYGTANAYKVSSQSDASQVILKYRVKAEDNAPQGDSNIKFIATANKNDPKSLGFTYNLPITIAKTKTDFDIVMQDSSSQGVSFAIANTGENDATAVTLSIPKQENVQVSGTSSSILGNMAKGDFTTVTFPITPNKNLQEIKMQVAYTDIAGIRNTIGKNVSVFITNGTALGISRNGSTTTKSSTNSTYLFIILGIVIGVVAVLAYNKFKAKK